MASLHDSDIQDLVTGTLKRLGKLRFNQIATRLQEYEAASRILKKEKATFGDGVGIQRTIMHDHSAAARNVGLHEPDVVSIGDVLMTISITWKHTTTNYSYERRELLMNRGESRITNLLKVRRTDAMIGLTEHLEDEFWSEPSATDDNRIFSLPYWITYYSATGSGLNTDDNGGGPGFLGDNHDSFSSGRGGKSTGDYPRWVNYAVKYTDITKDDAIAEMRTAYRRIRFKSPVDIPDFRRGSGDNYRIYTGEANIQDFEDVGEKQNENLGRDLASMDGVMTFRRNPIVWVPRFDTAPYTTYKPIYMLNWNYLSPVFLRGDYLRESAPKIAPNQHNTWVVHVDLTWNLLCTDLRCQAVLSIATNKS